MVFVELAAMVFAPLDCIRDRHRRPCRRLPLHPPLDQPLDVYGARVEMVEAVLKRVMKLLQMEMLGAPFISAVQKWAIVVVFGHL
jgi:hypothetical protein